MRIFYAECYPLCRSFVKRKTKIWDGTVIEELGRIFILSSIPIKAIMRKYNNLNKKFV